MLRPRDLLVIAATISTLVIPAIDKIAKVLLIKFWNRLSGLFHNKKCLLVTRKSLVKQIRRLCRPLCSGSRARVALGLLTSY
jgi:hypothetical protein